MAKRGIQGAILKGLGARDRTITVVGAEDITAHFRRIWFHAETLLNEIEVGPTAWLRLWIPDPNGGRAQYQRAYTISEVGEEPGRFAADFVLHEPAGPASIWARSVSGGESLEVMSLGSSIFEIPAELPAGYLIVGDAASLPAINAVLRTIPAEVEIKVYLEQHDPLDQQIPMTKHPKAQIAWAERDDADTLAKAIEARDLTGWRVWAAAESGSLKTLRTRLKGELGVPKSHAEIRAYWIEGKAMGNQWRG